MRAYFARHVGTYGEEAPMPCVDCQHSSRKGCSCKVSRHWENTGKVMHKKGSFKVPQLTEKMPDSNIKFAKHSWNK